MQIVGEIAVNCDLYWKCIMSAVYSFFLRRILGHGYGFRISFVLYHDKNLPVNPHEPFAYLPLYF